MVTEIANIISDAIIMKDNSKFNNRVEIYMAEGMSENEAKQKATMDAISDVALAGAGGFVAGGLLGGAVNVGKYSGALQNAGTRSGNNIPILSKYTANNQGTVTNIRAQTQQGGNGQTQTVGNTSVFDGKTGGRTHTQVAGNSNAPTAARSSGAMQTGTSANTQMPTAVQQQVQAQTDIQNGKSIKAEGKVTELLQEAMAQPADSPARQLAETLIAQQETALVEQGLELGSQYQISHAEQARLAAETANNAVSDREIGELERLLRSENSSKTYSDIVLANKDEHLLHKRIENFDKQGKINIAPQFFANKGILKQTNRELNKSISSWQKNIDLHKKKIKNPEKYDINWGDKSDAHKNGLLRHWEKEIANFEENIKKANALLKERGHLE